jgi:hypothetical protein
MKRKRLASSAATALQTSAKGSPKKRREETKKPLDMPVDLHDMECCFKGLFPMEAQDPDVIEEFLDFYKDFPPLKTQFKLLAKIGEGTPLLHVSGMKGFPGPVSVKSLIKDSSSLWK